MFKKNLNLTRRTKILLAAGTVSVMLILIILAANFGGSEALNFIYPLIGVSLIILIIRFATIQLQKLGVFLTEPYKEGCPKHSSKVMLLSMIKYLIFLFATTVCTDGIFIYPMILVWFYAMFISYRYIQLWKFHGYSVLLLIGSAVAAIIASIIVAPFFRDIIKLAFTTFLKIPNLFI